VAKDRSIDDYVQRISDHRPVLIRLSLAEATTPTSAGATGSELDRLLDEMIAAQSGVSRAPVRRSRDRSRDPQTRVVMPSR
jgi:hypothetical protein